jgi:prevent-host-death family protein
MKTVGSYAAKAHLAELLDQAAKGKRILITKRGKPVAMLVPPPQEEAQDVAEVVREMLAWRDREGPTLGGTTTVRQLIEEGRRF